MKRSLTLLTLVLLLTGAMAQQPLQRPVPDYAFANFDRNVIDFPGGSDDFEVFFNKLDSLFFFGKGHVNILHIGGSHIQAGVFSQTVRNDLLALCPGTTAARGLIFPFSAGRTNNPSSFSTYYTGDWSYCRNAVSFDQTLGLAGASITTNDPDASITIVARDRNPSDNSPTFDFNEVKVIGYSDCDSLVPLIKIDGITVFPVFDTEQSTYSFHLPYYTDSIRFFFSDAEGEFTLTGIYLDNGMPGISYNDIGVNGARVNSYLLCENFERDLALVKPDLVIFGIGINDASGDSFTKQAFKNDYRALIESIRNISPDCAILFISNNDSYKRLRRRRYAVNTNGLIVEAAFKELAREFDAGLWNQFDIMGGLRSMQQWQDHGLAQKDKVHFTNSGYRLIGDLLFNALIDTYVEHLRKTNKKSNVDLQ